MYSALARRAALLAMVAGFAVPASAQAHHIPTCNGFSDPQCNVNYFYAHQVEPVAGPYTSCVTVGGNVKYMLNCLIAALPQPIHDLRDEVNEVVTPVYNMVVDTVMDAACQYFGACD